jgi:hypothetical protein
VEIYRSPWAKLAFLFVFVSLIGSAVYFARAEVWRLALWVQKQRAIWLLVCIVRGTGRRG